MNAAENPRSSVSSPSEYILDNFEHSDRIALLILNRDLGETVQRITSAHKASSPEFQAWLRYKNANGADIYLGMNPLRQDASTRTKEDIEAPTSTIPSIMHAARLSRPKLSLDQVPDRRREASLGAKTKVANRVHECAGRGNPIPTTLLKDRRSHVTQRTHHRNRTGWDTAGWIFRIR